MLSTIARTFDFSGTADRRTFWTFYALYVVVGVILLLASDFADPKLRALLIAGLALITLPLPALTVRRLHDSGLNGAWAWLLVFSWLGQFILALLALRHSNTAATWPKISRHIVGRIAVLIIAALGIGRLIWEPYYIPSGSMKPTLLPGDYIIKPVWDGSFTRGDVVIFQHPLNGSAFVGRVIGRSGDTVEMQDGQVILTTLDGAPVRLAQTQERDFVEEYALHGPAQVLPLCQEKSLRQKESCTKTAMTETLAGRDYFVLNTFDDSRFDTVTPIPVPPGHSFILGDHRDNAMDSRAPLNQLGFGPVPDRNVLGAPHRVVFSGAGRVLLDITSWRWDRLWKRIE